MVLKNVFRFFLCLFLMVTVVSMAAGDVVSLNPDHDATVRGGKYADINMGLKPDLVVADYGVMESVFQSFLQFNLAEVSGPVEKATLKLHLPKIYKGDCALYFVPDDAWEETVITDNNKPPEAQLLAEWSVTDTLVEVDLTAIVALEADNDGLISLKLVSPRKFIRYFSDENGIQEKRPELIVEFDSGVRGRTYTFDQDFNEGDLINVNTLVPDQLQLSEEFKAFNFIWVAVSTKGTVVKIDTRTGEVLGEYYTAPGGALRNPSRTTVDQKGNVWVTNRNENSITCIGLYENGQWIDKNGDGICQTSFAQGNILPWTNAGGVDTNGGVSTAEDECILFYVRTTASGTRHVAVDENNNVWVSGTGGRQFDLIDGNSGTIIRSEPSVGFGGYGGLIDKNGVIWSSNPLLRWDTSLPLTGPNGVNWRGYTHDSYGLGIDSDGNVWNTSLNGGQIRKFAPDGTLIGTYYHGNTNAQGCAADEKGDIWVAHSLYQRTVGHIKNDGTYIGNIEVGAGPTGVAVDGDGKIWVTLYDGRTAVRIDPAAGPLGADGVTPIGAVDLVTVNLGGQLYNYSDMTGSTLIGAPEEGTWSVVYDTEVPGAKWGQIQWNALRINDGKLTVSVASSEDNVTYSLPVGVVNDSSFVVPNGRYLKVTVNFEAASSGESPILYDLTVGTQGYAMPPISNDPPLVNAGSDFEIMNGEVLALAGMGSDDDMPPGGTLVFAWSQIDGPGVAAFTAPNMAHTNVSFSAPGVYLLELSVSDGDFLVSDMVTVTVIP